MMTIPFAPSHEIDGLREAATWPNPSPRVLLVLMNQLLAAGRHDEAYELFDKISHENPDRGLPLAIAGVALSRMDGRIGDALTTLDDAVAREVGVPNYLRGIVRAQAGIVEGIADLELVVALPDRFPPGLRRSAYHGLAKLYAVAGRPEDAQRAKEKVGTERHESLLAVDFWVTDEAGFQFVPPRLVEVADGVHVAQGFGFSDIAFVHTGAGVIAIDAGGTPGNAADALAAYRAISTDPITHVLITHGHWDHVGGLSALRGPETRVVARSNLHHEDRDSVPFSRFLPAGETPRGLDSEPDQLIDAPTTLRIGELDVALIPVSGGETDDALLVHLPDRGVLFVGDIMMPYLGAPFFAEGSPEGLIEGMRAVERLAPRIVIHGHPPLTENFTADTIPHVRPALESLLDRVRADVRDWRTLGEILRRNHLPESLREHPDAVLPYLLLRDGLINRTHRQHTGYWQADGEGVEHIFPDEWALALDLLADGDPVRHAEVVRALVDRDHLPVALRLVDHALARHPGDPALSQLRQQTLERLVQRNVNIGAFRFVIYSGLSGIELPAPQL
jgi:glyoxylase-like metal-dependent hydrolase (beta-lactamase superfamily II)